MPYCIIASYPFDYCTLISYKCCIMPFGRFGGESIRRLGETTLSSSAALYCQNCAQSAFVGVDHCRIYRNGCSLPPRASSGLGCESRAPEFGHCRTSLIGSRGAHQFTSRWGRSLGSGRGLEKSTPSFLTLRSLFSSQLWKTPAPSLSTMSDSHDKRDETVEADSVIDSDPPVAW